MTQTLLANINTATFAVGFAAFCSGIAGWLGGAIAAVVGGGILMLIAAWPYIRAQRAPRTHHQ